MEEDRMQPEWAACTVTVWSGFSSSINCGSIKSNCGSCGSNNRGIFRESWAERRRKVMRSRVPRARDPSGGCRPTIRRTTPDLTFTADRPFAGERFRDLICKSVAQLCCRDEKTHSCKRTLIISINRERLSRPGTLANVTS